MRSAEHRCGRHSCLPRDRRRIWQTECLPHQVERASSVPVRCGRRFVSSTLGFSLGLVLFFLVVPAMLIGWNANLHHLDTWGRFMLTKADNGGMDPRSGNSHSARNQSLQNAAYRLGNFGSHVFADGPDDRLVENFDAPKMAMDSPAADRFLFLSRAMLGLALLALGVRLARRARQPVEHGHGLCVVVRHDAGGLAGGACPLLPAACPRHPVGSSLARSSRPSAGGHHHGRDPAGALHPALRSPPLRRPRRPARLWNYRLAHGRDGADRPSRLGNGPRRESKRRTKRRILHRFSTKRREAGCRRRLPSPKLRLFSGNRRQESPPTMSN